MLERFLEDFEVGQRFSGPTSLRVEPDRIKAFAAEFDPQPFHLDEAAAARSVFGGLAASGWHTAAMPMRLLVASELRPAGGIVGAGFEEFRWPRPVRPGDELRVEAEILEVRPSRTRPEQGVIKVRTTTLNQRGESVQVSVGTVVRGGPAASRELECRWRTTTPANVRRASARPADDVLKRRVFEIAVTGVGDYSVSRSCRGPERGPAATLLRQ